jgi:hypothetical protein
LSLATCNAFPDASERLDDDLVFTSAAPNADFKAYQTFAVDPDVHLATVREDGTVESTTLERGESDAIVARVATNLEQRGFRRVSPNETPDLGITLTAISGLAVGAVTGYWWGTYAWYWGFPGWGYYYPYEVAYAYRTGTLVLETVDLVAGRKLYPGGALPDASLPDAGPGSGGLPVVWGMLAYKAFVDDDSSVRTQTVTTAIDQAFIQSPYLGRE